ncbi:MAG: hypothetical protein CM15mP68_4390 [Pseudomonadota bacterium]|nr:MAG: hypothetical protein CM15mP68_4390 [Pseudomonadota bacterium]
MELLLNFDVREKISVIVFPKFFTIKCAVGSAQLLATIEKLVRLVGFHHKKRRVPRRADCPKLFGAPRLVPGFGPPCSKSQNDTGGFLPWCPTANTLVSGTSRPNHWGEYYVQDVFHSLVSAPTSVAPKMILSGRGLVWVGSKPSKAVIPAWALIRHGR